MKTEFRRALLPAELKALVAFDRKVFLAPDCFDPEYWLACDAWWLLVSGRKIGCCAFERPRPKARTLYIATTAILPGNRGLGYGRLMKAWQIVYANAHGYRRLTTHTRKSNRAMIALNRAFGFKLVKTVPGYYINPVEPGVFMELRLTGKPVPHS